MAVLPSSGSTSSAEGGPETRWVGLHLEDLLLHGPMAASCTERTCLIRSFEREDQY